MIAVPIVETWKHLPSLSKNMGISWRFSAFAQVLGDSIKKVVEKMFQQLRVMELQT